MQKTSPMESVVEMYDTSALSYAEMMDAEIKLPLYSNVLNRLFARIKNQPGILIDTSCGSGHMLSMYHHDYDRSRELLGIDLSPKMVSIAGSRLGTTATIRVGDMRDLQTVDSQSAAAVISFFAIHHLDPGDVRKALTEWHRVLHYGGALVLGAWEGAGVIDYAGSTDIVSLKYKADELSSMVTRAGYEIASCTTEVIAEMAMTAVYFEAVKPQQFGKTPEKGA